MYMLFLRYHYGGINLLQSKKRVLLQQVRWSLLSWLERRVWTCIERKYGWTIIWTWANPITYSTCALVSLLLTRIPAKIQEAVSCIVVYGKKCDLVTVNQCCARYMRTGSIFVQIYYCGMCSSSDVIYAWLLTRRKNMKLSQVRLWSSIMTFLMNDWASILELFSGM